MIPGAARHILGDKNVLCCAVSEGIELYGTLVSEIFPQCDLLSGEMQRDLAMLQQDQSRQNIADLCNSLLHPSLGFHAIQPTPGQHDIEQNLEQNMGKYNARQFNMSELWIWKNLESWSGEGVEVMTRGEIQSKVANGNRVKAVVQKYVDDILTLDGFKFDSRWLLLSKAYCIVFRIVFI